MLHRWTWRARLRKRFLLEEPGHRLVRREAEGPLCSLVGQIQDITDIRNGILDENELRRMNGRIVDHRHGSVLPCASLGIARCGTSAGLIEDTSVGEGLRKFVGDGC